MAELSTYPRGAEWRQWDLHIHSPASFHWDGARFDADPNASENTLLIDQMIEALNSAAPAVYALMDYWTFDGWFALKKRLAQKGAPKLEKVVFPGIELRLMAPMDGRLNAHVIFSDSTPDQILLDFKSALTVELINSPLSNHALIELARKKVGEDKLKHHGFIKSEVDSNDATALRAGSTIAEINCDSYKRALERIPQGSAVGFMPFSTSDGLDEIKWQEHYAYVLGLFNSSPIFETRNSDLWAAFAGVRTAKNAKWLDNFQYALSNTPRLAVSGSDAHRFKGTANNDQRGYGDFPTGKATWIKADPTFLGLLQAIKEPAKRCHIGDIPDKLQSINQSKTYFIDRVEVRKMVGSKVEGNWLSDCNLPLNPDLIAIIGNKGSGKSALADVIALLGNTRQREHLSFLSSKRFRAKPKELAKHFQGQITWLDDSKSAVVSLNDDPDPTAVEMVRYIPQLRFEKLCNDHVSGVSDVFEKELRAVIFDHTNPAIRQKALDFDQLTEQQERSYRDQLGELRKDLRRLNLEIESMEAQLQPEVRKTLEEQWAQKNKQIEEHDKIKPVVETKPSDQLTPDQEIAIKRLDEIAASLKQLDDDEKLNITNDALIATKIRSAQSVRERVRILQRQYQQFGEETAQDLQVLGIQQPDIADIKIDEGVLLALINSLPTDRDRFVANGVQIVQKKQALSEEQGNLRAKLNEPLQRHQQSVNALEAWGKRRVELVGAADIPESLSGVAARLEQLDNLPASLSDRGKKRDEISGEIFDVLEKQRLAREQLFAPVQDVIQNNQLIRDEYKLQFQATLGGSAEALATALFNLIKQTASAFREGEGVAVVKRIAEQLDLGKKEDVLKLISEIHAKVATAASSGNSSGIGISSILKAGRSQSGGNISSADVYDLLYGLAFLEPRYSLLYQDTQIEQLSPGQRGALLLIFYLLVDKGTNPIILDQPEENLDNETVFSLLVPVLTEAKKKRQVIMVTHNPNLAVVCDAEQVIYSSFDRKNGATIKYVPGSIESPVINKHVVNVLEGTKVAFDNRRNKYH
ncbi:ABC transporter [Rugosibacter aromaticivorans]|uniref:ABC transporter n=1 Tax=Rugosibacter aromaticivorans TaxID=1565605 RepID=A0A0C5JA34_9PROT|nr:hypothetical protein [Rugosibacter aromaticivorans]AJP48598.1 ABC transporter [Rugosibacter aromaticivorans]TBR13667.1 MAG: ABC transporter [Rugosibacter sp.]